jgi:hypothetical protein
MPPISKTLTALLGGVVLSLMCASTAGASCPEPSQLLGKTLVPPPGQAAPTLLRPSGQAALASRLAGGGQFGHAEENAGPNPASLRDRIVGTWLVTYGGTVTGQAFIQWHSDGTEWENIDHPTLDGNICMGDWRVVDEHHVKRSHVGWLFSNGNKVGYFVWTETNEVARDGSWYRGTNYLKVYDVNGHLLVEGPGTSEATRIPQP